MKKFLYPLLLLLLTTVCAATVSAKDISYEDFDEQWYEFLTEIPQDIADVLPDSLSDTLSGKTDKPSTSAFFKTVLSYFSAGIGTYGKYLISLLAVLLLCSVFEILKSTLKSGALHEVLSLAGNLSLSLAVCSSQTRLIDYTLTYLRNLSGVATGTLPIFASVFATSGNFTLAAVHSGGVSLVIVLIENIFCHILAPLLKICFCFHFISVFVTNKYFNEIHKVLKSIYTTLLVFVMSIFTLVMGAKQVLAAGADNFIIRGAKYAVGSFVPIVTSVISGNLTTVASALTVIKNACGIAGVIIVLLMLLPVVISLILNRFVLKIAAGVAGILGETQQEKLLSDTASLNGYLISLAVCGAILFIYLLALIVTTTLALGG